MSSLRNARPRPFATRLVPAYPRLLTIGALALIGCAGQLDATGEQASAVETQADGGHGQGINPSGAAPGPFDGGAPDADVEDGDVDGGAPDASPDVNPAGDIAYPFDAGEPDTSTGVDSGADARPDPDPAGGIAESFDAGAP